MGDGHNVHPDGSRLCLPAADWFSRRVLAWRLSITLGVDFCLEAVEDALARARPGDRQIEMNGAGGIRPLQLKENSVGHISRRLVRMRHGMGTDCHNGLSETPAAFRPSAVIVIKNG
jgi:hypothetical protein